jgi:DNA-binding CsgD family transcriptional regulator
VAASEAVPDVVGRDDELAAIAAFLDAGPRPPAALALDGEAGIGKTILWLRSTELAAQRSYRVLATRPTELDSELPFAGLGDLLAGTVDDVLARLPSPQRSALEVALLLVDRDDRAPNQSALAFAFLNGLRALAREGPVAVAIDDVQWLDTPSARLVRFAAQRLEAEPIRLLLARRSNRAGPAPLDLDRALPGRVRTVGLGPLSLGALHQLMRTRVGVAFARPALRQLHESSGGNPFYALEIARSFMRRGTQMQPGGTFPVPDDLHDLTRERLEALPAPTREALLVAALVSNPTLELVDTVVGREGDLLPAIDARVITEHGDTLRFAHPLFAAAIREQAGRARARRLHVTLAELAPSAEERALHLALGSRGVNEAAAAKLADAARDARRRGAPATAAALLEHALRLAAPDDAVRLRWEVEAAEACFEAGDTERAAARLRAVADRLAPGNPRAEVLTRLATLTAALGDSATGFKLAQQALEEFEGGAALEVAIRAELSWRALFVNDLAGALAHARRAADLSVQLDDADLAAQALTSLSYMEFTAGLPSHVASLERALAEEQLVGHVYIDRSPTLERGFQLLWMGDLPAARSSLERVQQLARDRGDESSLSICAGALAALEVMAGDWERSGAHAREAVELAQHTGVNWPEAIYHSAMLDAHLGRVEASLDGAHQLLARAEAGNEAIYLVFSLSVLGFVELSRGDAKAAHDSLGRAAEVASALGIGEPGLLRCMADEVEALVALGRVADAAEVLERFEQQARVLGRAWALATAERCCGLVLGADGDLAEAIAALERAREGHQRAAMPFELGRTLLVLGAAQRRARERRAARESLSEALRIFESLGARLWADKARAELGRIGGRTPANGALTPAEQRIAELVARGLTNREVAAELILAVHTVEATLTRIYGKLGVRSRSELARRF